jgi:DNA-binding LytR/AlgR family response regulator
MNVIRAAICDDEKSQSEYIELLLNEWAALRGLRVKVSVFENAERFLFNYDGRQIYDLILLDIQMNEMSGVELAKRIRETGDGAEIVFITGFPDFMSEGYEVNALHYLLKPVSPEKVREVLDRAMERRAERPRTLLLPMKGGAVRVRAGDIVYAEVLSHTITLHMAGGEQLNVAMRITDMEELLGEGFFKCHRSYIVALARVRRVTRTAVLLDDGRELPLARGLYVAANKAFIEFN